LRFAVWGKQDFKKLKIMSIKISIKSVWALFIVLGVCLMVVQSLWLYNAFIMKEKEIQEQINKCIEAAIKEDVKVRLPKFELKQKNLTDSIMRLRGTMDSTIRMPSNSQNYDTLSMEYEDALEAGFFQSLLDFTGFPLQIDTLDSLLQIELKKSDINLTYNLCYKDSNGVIIEQRENLLPAKAEKAFLSDSFLIVYGKKIQAVVDISNPFVFKKMLWLLLVSALLIIAVALIAYLLAQKLLNEKKLNQFRNDFVNAFTHNMKSPLTQIYITLDNINAERYDKRPEIRDKHIKAATAGIRNLQRQIEQILTIAQSETGSLAVKPGNTDVIAMMEALTERYSVVDKKPVSISTSYNSENMTACLDRPLIEDAVSNLIDNAIKYSGESVAITLECSIIGNQLTIKVTDNGLGISDEDRDKIFEKYERGAAFGRQNGAKGFGLGLNYVKRIVEAHGGTVQLYSTLGKGSEFSVILPVK
jgi:two-component system phosphate regulon sensor histidine kinase PhoR